MLQLLLCIVKHKSSHRQYAHRWAWLCSNKTLFIKTGRPDLSHRPLFANPHLLESLAKFAFSLSLFLSLSLSLSLFKFYSGKFGQVFRLVEKKTGKIWAGKFFKAYSAKEKENIRQEISIMNCLHHPKLVQCVDAFEDKANIVMVLEM